MDVQLGFGHDFEQIGQAVCGDGFDLISGHIHDPYIRLSNERYPQLQKPMIIGVAVTCLSHRTREDANNSFNVIDIEDIETPKLTVSRHDLTADVVFEARESHRFIRTHNQGWQKN